MVEIQADSPFEHWMDREALSRAAEAALAWQASDSNRELTIVLTGDDQVRALNREHLSRDYTTDVLAFPAGIEDPDSGLLYLGDVIISCPQAARQAQEQGHPVGRELQLLVIHGILHLLGLDDRLPEDRARMWQIQEEILARSSPEG